MYVKHWCFPTLIFYILLAIIIALLFKKSIKYKKNSDSKFNKKYICYFLIYLIFIIFSCLRVIQPGIGGADTYNYIKYFNTMQYVNFNLKDIVLFNGFEYIFYNLMFFIRIIGGNFYMFMFIIYSTIILSYIYVVDKSFNEERKWFWLILLFLPLLKSINIIRVCVAAAIGFVAIEQLKNDKIFKFLILTTVAILNQYIAFILLAFLIFIKVFPEKILLNKKNLIFLNCISIIGTFIFLPLAKYFLSISGFSGYLNKIEISLLGYIPIFFFYILMILDKKFITYLKNIKHVIYYKVMAFLSLVLPIFILLNGASRILLFFEIPRYIMYADIYDFYKNKIPKKYHIISDILVLFLIIFWLIFRIYRMWLGYEIMPYHNILFS